MEKNDRIRIELTSEQQKQVKEASGQEVSAIELTATELEQRITPDFVITKSTDISSPKLFSSL